MKPLLLAPIALLLLSAAAPSAPARGVLTIDVGNVRAAAGLVQVDQRKYGDTVVTLLKAAA